MAIADALKGETTFVPSPYRSSHTESGLTAFAKRFQTLMVMEPGTLPNCVDAGVGIGLYVSEFADENTMDEIKLRIGNQLNSYLEGSELISDLQIKIIDDPNTGAKVLGMVIKLSHNIDGKKAFALTFAKGNGSATKDNVVSDFYF
jgi:hypothetical protein